MQDRQFREALDESVTDAPAPLVAADRLCEVCVEFLEVDGASISYLGDGTMQGTFGSSDELSRTLDELQFTYGEGPCLDAVQQGRPVMAPYLGGPGEARWPALTESVLELGIRAVFALPVRIAGTPIGALDLYRRSAGPLEDHALAGGMRAAGLAALPLLDLMSSDTDWQQVADASESWDQLESLERVEVYQATGVIIAALDISPADALIRLRAYAISHSLTASEVAYRILGRRLRLTEDEWDERGSDPGGST